MSTGNALRKSHNRQKLLWHAVTVQLPEPCVNLCIKTMSVRLGRREESPPGSRLLSKEKSGRLTSQVIVLHKYQVCTKPLTSPK